MDKSEQVGTYDPVVTNPGVIEATYANRDIFGSFVTVVLDEQTGQLKVADDSMTQDELDHALGKLAFTAPH